MGRHLARTIACALVAACAAALLLASGCAGGGDAGGGDAGGTGAPAVATEVTPAQESGTMQLWQPVSGPADVTLKVASGSENKEAAAAIQHAVDVAGVNVEIHYMGSLDIMKVLQAGGEDYDAVWPASSIWISMGDTKHVVRDSASTSTTPVVLGVAKSKAIELGWADETGATTSPTTAEILAAVERGELTFAMTSATQSISGASAYLAFLGALSGHEGPLTADDLADPELTGKVSALLAGVDRSSGSSDWLKEMVVADPDAHQAMVNYESLVSQANRELEAAGHEPMLVVYPADGIAVSDSPLAYVDRGQGAEREEAFSAFQEALADDTSRLEMERVGRRTGLGGKVSFADDELVAQAFSPEWGIVGDAGVLRTVPMPSADVIRSALALYQTSLKKPSYTVWVVDYSGSMSGPGKEGVVDGLAQALDPALAAESMVQPTEGDVNVLVPFSSEPDEPVVANGSETAGLLEASRSREATGGTDVYAGLDVALELAERADADGTRTVAIVLMTDGRSETYSREDFVEAYEASGVDVPVFSIMFGDADPTQLDELSELTNGRTFDGREGDLAAVFRQVKGYN